MTPNEFVFLCKLLKDHSGIHMQEDKRYLFETRLQPVISASGHQNLSDFIQSLMRSSNNTNMIQKIVEAMTTNESMFFRDTRPFEVLRNTLLPEFRSQQIERPLSIWCAACSSGQEAYSIAMMMDEDNAPPCHILGTDIDAKIINKAKEGSYSQFEVQRGLPAHYLLRYFEQISPYSWQIKDALKEHITFEVKNLLECDMMRGQFDIVLCRYVLIYFDDDTKRDALAKIAKRMPSGGYLLLGSAETLLADVHDFTPHPTERSVYIRK